MLRGPLPIGRLLAPLCALLCLLLAPAGAGAATADGSEPAEDAIGGTSFTGSWLERALDLQYELASDLPLRRTPWVGTHNSYNSVAEMGPLISPMDSNQHVTMLDQLRMGVRSLELDVHRFVSVRDLQTGVLVPILCHGLPIHVGCTLEKSLREALVEIGGWLQENPTQVLLLYLEDHLDSEQGYDAGAGVIHETIGDLVYRPPSGACEQLPMDLTRDQVREAGKQVVLMADSCGVGANWPWLAFDGTNRDQSRPRGFRDYPDCGPDFERADYDRTLIRYFEDRTHLTNNLAQVGAAEADDGLTPETAAAMTRCGVDLIGFDHLLQDDGRLEATIWSWAPGEPRDGAGDCVVQRPDGRWEARPCGERHRAACRSDSGAWIVPPGMATASGAPGLCGPRGTLHAVPRTGFQGQQLRDAQGANTVWLGHRRRAETWEPFEPTVCTPSLRRSDRRWPVRRSVARVAVRLRLPCTGEMLARRVVVRGGRQTVRGRTGRTMRVPVSRRTRSLRVEFTYLGKRRARNLRLR